MIPSVRILDPAVLTGMGLLFHNQLTLDASAMATRVDCAFPTSESFFLVESSTNIENLDSKYHFVIHIMWTATFPRFSLLLTIPLPIC